MEKRREGKKTVAINPASPSRLQPFTLRVCEIVKSIPPGRVTTYGIIASHAGSSSSARQVARILSSVSAGHDLPWHRVVNRRARISLEPGNGYALQKDLLEAEGVRFDDSDCIDFSLFLWWPETYCRPTGSSS